MVRKDLIPRSLVNTTTLCWVNFILIHCQCICYIWLCLAMIARCSDQCARLTSEGLNPVYRLHSSK